MGNNQHFRDFRPIIAIGLFLISIMGYAQTYNYAATGTSTSPSGVTNPEYAGGTDMSNAARLSSTLTANNRNVQVTWTGQIAANTPVYIKVHTETTLLSGLLGGAIGGLVTNLAALLVDGQSITLSARVGSGTASSVTIDGSFNNENSTTTKIVQDAAGDTYIRLVPSVAFDNIVITNTRFGITGATPRYVDVFGAYTLSNIPSCTAAQFTGYTGNSIVSANITAGAGNTNAHYAIDTSAATYSTLALGTAAVGAYLEQQFYFVGTNSSTDVYNIRLHIPASALQVGLLNAARIVYYNGNTVLGSVSAYSLLSADALTLLGNNQSANISVTPGYSNLTKIGVRYVSVANIALTDQMHIHSVNKGSFTLTAAANHANGNYFLNETATLTATATGCSTYTYSWTPTNRISGTSTAASVTALTDTVGSTTYTVTATDAFGNTKTATVTINVLQPPVGGSLSGGGFVCYNTLPGNITLTGYTGTIVRWEKSTNSDFSGAVTIPGTAGVTIVNGSQLGALTETTYVRAVISHNGYPTFAYATTTLTVKTTVWNGTAWSNGVPDINTMIFFTGNYNQNIDLNGCAIQVNNNANVSILADKTVTLQYNITVSAGSSMTFQNNAHLLQNSATSTNVGNVTIIRNSSALFRLDYTLWSTPVTGQKLLAFSPATALERFYEYKYAFNTNTNQNFEGYYIVSSPSTTDFEVAKAYLIRMPNGDPAPNYNAGTGQLVFAGNFTGVPNNGTYQRALSVQGDRYTAIGNPYPSPINVQAFFDANLGVLQNGSALYFWRKKNNTNASSYATMTRDTYVSNPATGGNTGENQYGGEIWDDFFHNQVTAANWVINPAQGFLVQTSSSLSSANITFNNGMRRNVHNNQFFRPATPDGENENSTFFLDITSSADVGRLAMVYSNTATTGMDQFRDARKIFDNGMINFYSVADTEKLVVQARPFTATDLVPLGYKANAARQYTISVGAKNGLFTQGQAIYLKDKAEGITRNISENPYTFTTEAGTFDNRFEIAYNTTVLGTEDIVADVNNVVIYKNNGVVNIDAGTLNINGVQVYDINGRLLYNRNNVNTATSTIEGLNVQTQVLIVKVDTTKGTVTKKVVF
ncbi:MAG: T9SS sorting signal type C domain-containing protein [Bacteroidia bacterium]